MNNTVNSLLSSIVERPAEIKRLRAGGTRVVGFFPGDFVPDELVYAAGAVPVCLVHGGNPNVVDASVAVTTRFLCPFARAQMGEEVLREQPYYTQLDLLVSPITCQHLRRAGDVWDYYSGVEVFRFGIPYKYGSSRGLDYYLNMLKLLKARLEKLTGNTVTDSKLWAAIELYNRLRGLLKRIGETRKLAHPPVTTLDFIKLNHASFYLDPATVTGALARAAAALEPQSARKADPKRTPLVLTGPCVAYGDYRILELIDECGGEIVVEEVAEGVRGYRTNVAVDGDPLKALAVKYLRDRLPPAFMRFAAKRRFDFVTGLAREYGAEGIVWYQLLYCDTYDIESYYFGRNLETAGLPMLKLESDYTVQDRGPLKTRIEAFLEAIGSRRQ